jgi:hypothetical protein
MHYGSVSRLYHPALSLSATHRAHSTSPRSQPPQRRVLDRPANAGREGAGRAQSHQAWLFRSAGKMDPRAASRFRGDARGAARRLQPQSALEESCVTTMALSYVRMAAMLRYENIAALEYHQQQDRQMSERIATAKPAEAAHLRAQRQTLRRAGLWEPTIPGPREAKAIIRYSGCLDRTIRRAAAELESSRRLRKGSFSAIGKMQKQNHYSAPPNNRPAAADGPRIPLRPNMNVQKQTHFEAPPSTNENTKTNPLSSMFMGNRHERRRAKALAKRHR